MHQAFSSPREKAWLREAMSKYVAKGDILHVLSTPKNTFNLWKDS